MLAKACTYTIRHTELEVRILSEACARMLKGARSLMFILRSQACISTQAQAFILYLRTCTEAHA